MLLQERSGPARMLTAVPRLVRLSSQHPFVLPREQAQDLATMIPGHDAARSYQN